MEENLSTKISSYITERAKPKLEELTKKAEKERKKAADSPEALAEVEAALAEEEIALKSKFEPAVWLTDAARRAGQIQFTTHPIKFTNSQAKGASSCYAESGPQQPAEMLEGSLISTASLAKPAIDVDGNAAALDVAALLQLEQDGRMLLKYIQAQDAEPLRPFAKSDEQLADWLEGFSQAVSVAAPSSHSLAKQLYFPVGDGQYHLLSPLFSSSLAQAVHERIHSSRFSDKAKEVRKAKREEKFHESLAVDYPNTAVMTFGGTKPQNVSQLNSRRGGKVYLLSCTPPVWKRMSVPPLKTSTVFSRHHFGARVHQETYLLNKFLERVLDQDSTKGIRDRREELIDRIIDQLIQYTAEVWNSFAAGWSSDEERCKLNHHEQLWLDPMRSLTDPAFKAEREQNEWQEEIAARFARWLNRRIDKGEGQQILFTGDVERREWKKELKNEWKNLLKEKCRQLEKSLEELA
jgi:CRISPR-associated protein Csy1